MTGLRIATFNLENLGVEGGADVLPLDERLATLRAQLLRLEADVLCLQEVNAQRLEGGEGRRSRRVLTALDRLLEGTDYARFHRVHAGATADESRLADRHNLVTLSRWPIVSHRRVMNDLVAPPRYRPATAAPAGGDADVGWDRPVLLAAIDLPRTAEPAGRRLHVANLHLRAPLAAPVSGQKEHGRWGSLGGWAEGFYLATMKRAGQALEVRLMIEEIFDAWEAETRGTGDGDAAGAGDEAEADADAGGPLIAVLGDFNAEERQTPLAILKGMVAAEDLADPSLAARRLVALAERLPPERRYTVLHDGRKVMIDHLLASQALAAAVEVVGVDNRGLGDEARDEAAGRRIPGSHHAPLVASFRWG